MKKHYTLEERIVRLEREIANRTRHKNEFLGIFNKPRRSEERSWLDKIFSKYSSIKKAFQAETQELDKGQEKKTFHIVLSARDKKYDGLYFIISTKGGRDEMYCTAYNGLNERLASLSPFNMDKDINNVAMFILKQLEKYESRCYSMNIKNESVPLNPFDCEKLSKAVSDNLKDLKECEVDVTDDNADYGFVNIGIYNPDFVTDYYVIANKFNSFEVDYEDKSIGEADSLEGVGKIISDHFKKNYNK